MDKCINLGKVTNGKMSGDIWISASGWETRYSWGHSATVTNTSGDTLAAAKFRYYNRTWERYEFQSVLHEVLFRYVRNVTGVDLSKHPCKRDQNPMKGKDAESRRLERVAARQFAHTLYGNLRDIVDGNATEEQIASKVA